MIHSVSHISRRMQSKHLIIKKLVQNNTVVHYGCIDDNEKLIMRKAKRGYYLHQIVTDSSKSTRGVDINKEGIEFLKKKLSITNVVYGNVEDPQTFTLDKSWLKRADVVLIPDLIEHLNNPGSMLYGIKNYYSKNVRIIITTPNPYAWYNFAATLFNLEIYSPHHTMSFSIKNMAVLLDNCGFIVEKISPVYVPKERNSVLKIIDFLMSRIAVIISPGFADAFLYECSIKK